MRPRIARFLVRGRFILESFISRPTNCRSPARRLPVVVAHDKRPIP